MGRRVVRIMQATLYEALFDKKVVNVFEHDGWVLIRFEDGIQLAVWDGFVETCCMDEGDENYLCKIFNKNRIGEG